MALPPDQNHERADWRDGVVSPSRNASGLQLMKNFVAGYVSLAVSLLLSLFLTPIALHHLGTERYGLWVVIIAAGSYIGILGAGVETAAVQQISALTAINDVSQLRDTVRTARVFFLCSGLISGLVLLLLVPLASELFHPSHGLLDSTKLAIILMAVISGVTMITNMPQAILLGSGRADRGALLGIVVSVGTQGGQIAVVLLGGGIVGLFSVSALFAAFGFVLLDRIVARSGVLPSGRSRFSKTILRSLLQSGRRNIVVAVSGAIAYNLDAIVIGLILPLARVTPYDLALSTANLARSGSTAGTNLLMPTYAHRSALDESERAFRLWSRAVLVSLALNTPILVCLILFGQSILRLWLGPVPAQTYDIVVALNVVLFVQLPGHQSFIFLTGVGLNGKLARVGFPASLVNLTLSVGATYWLGPIGPAVGSMPQVVVLDFVLLPLMCCRAMGVPFKRYISTSLTPLLVPLVVALASGALLAWLLGTASEYRAPFQCVVICVAAWMAMAVVLVRKDSELRSFVTNIRAERRLH